MCEVKNTMEASQDDIDNTQSDNMSDIFTVQVVPPRHITLPPTSSGKPPKEGSAFDTLVGSSDEKSECIVRVFWFVS